MLRESKKINQEFGFESEAEAVKEYSSLNRDFMSFNYPLIVDEIISGLDLEKRFILDVGTGLGSLACEFAKKVDTQEVYGIDISPQMLAAAEENARKEKIANIKFILCDIHNLEFPDNFFDLIVSFGVLHHLKDISLAFQEMRRVLKKGASAFIYDLRKDAPQEVVSEINSHMLPLQRKAFMESQREALKASLIEKVLLEAGIFQYSLSYPEYSRETVRKNKDLLRRSKLCGQRFNRVLLQVYFKK